MAATEDELEALMRRSLTGDAHAHESLLRNLASLLRSYFFGRLRSRPSDVEDLVQETLIAIHTRRSTYEPSRPLLAWVYAIAKYKLIDFLRRLKAAGEAVELTDDVRPVEFEGAASARLDLETILASLPGKQAQAIRSMQVEGQSAAEVASRHGWTESDVKVSAHRGLKTLRERFSSLRT